MSETIAEKRVVFCGDVNLAAREGFPALLEAHANLSQVSPKLRMFRVPFAGERLSGYAKRIQRDVLTLAPELLVIIPGSADFLFEVRPKWEQWVTHVHEAISVALSSLSKERIVLCSSLPLSEDPGYSLNAATADFNRALKEMANTQAISYCDLFFYLQETAPKVRPARLTVDGFTLSPVGNFLVFLRLSAFLGLDRNAPASSAGQ
ncbi:MAG: hypothetical protein WC712_12600 [Candidatus Brocadiia bacterium]